jgi:NAD(P)-dependent dehydrogenase (short-subunit alcohol dehydrogenase family)
VSRRTAWDAGHIPDLHGRVALVTGVTGDLGRETARELARKGARVLLTGRDEGRLGAVADRLRADLPDAELDTVVTDLADLSSIRRAAAEVLDRAPALDILVNNAGVMATPERRTADGFELQFGTNHLGHFALTGLLLPALQRARVTTVTSLMHRIARRHPLHDPREQRPYRKWGAYGESKLANLMFTLELGRRARAAGLALTSTAAHPGYTATHLQTSGPQLEGRTVTSTLMAWATPVLGQSARMGALPTLYAATAPGLPDGTLVGPSRLGESRGHPTIVGMSRLATDAEAAARLWDLSEKATSVTYLS